MKEAHAMVSSFHKKHDFPSPGVDTDFKASDEFSLVQTELKAAADSFEDDKDEHVYNLRLCLILEEVSELMEAMANNDSVEILDAVVDLLYVVIGTGVALNLPIVHAFHEVHRSNMTKIVGDIRVRDKGPEFEPPRLPEILRGWESNQLETDHGFCSHVAAIDGFVNCTGLSLEQIRILRDVAGKMLDNQSEEFDLSVLGAL